VTDVVRTGWAVGFCWWSEPLTDWPAVVALRLDARRRYSPTDPRTSLDDSSPLTPIYTPIHMHVYIYHYKRPCEYSVLHHQTEHVVLRTCAVSSIQGHSVWRISGEDIDTNNNTQMEKCRQFL